MALIKYMFSILIYPPPPAKGGISIRRKDLDCLGNGKHLNDAIVNFYMRYLHLEVTGKCNRKKFYVFDTCMYLNLYRNKDKTAAERHEAVKRWTKKIDILEKEFILLPINQK